ncbi:Ketosamine-3-kinase [Dactylellina cionopaga]|nr:Ketosamine-3-kinase [Dactylellina cionopaga]
MASQRDQALAAALNLYSSQMAISRIAGGSGFASTLKVQSGDKRFFVKTGTGQSSKVMFEGEYESLNAIYNAVPELCPRGITHGQIGDDTYFLATEFLELGGGFSKRSGDSLAVKLAKLHSQSAPSNGRFGFPVTTCCGSTPQNNTYEDSWSSFFVNRRLLSILQSCIESNGSQPELTDYVNRIVPIAKHLLSRLSPVSSKPVVIHGDLWSGNQSQGSIPPRITTPVPVVFDPSGCYAPAEYDHGIMAMFGGFDRNFWKEYESIVPRGEPVEEYEDRVALYTLYHTLNHYALFGGGYKESAMRIMKDLIRKYGSLVET